MRVATSRRKAACGLTLCAAGLLWLAAFPPRAIPASPPAEVGATLFPLEQVRPGMKGIGKTVFTGSKVEQFQVEILGVLKNIAPRQSVILARLSGGPLERTGVMNGMSGSPVYIDGRLLGAVALAFQFSKEPIAGITPIEQMLAAFEEPSAPQPPQAAGLAWRFQPAAGSADSLRVIPLKTPELLPPAGSRKGQFFWGGTPASLVHIATPLMFSGFTPEAIEYFQPQLRSLGLVPMQGGSGGTLEDDAMGDPSRLEPGSMISVQLVRGDMGVNADGTVTLIDQGRVYAFGHRLLSAGPTEIPFAESRVITPLPSYASSLKISTPGRLLGTIGQDRASGIFGVLGRRARMVPIEVQVVSDRQTSHSYRFEVVKDRFLLPFLVNLTVFSAISSTERMVGDSTLQVVQTISLEGLPDVQIENYFSGNANAPAVAAQSAATPLVYLMQSGLEHLDVQSIRFRINSTERRLTQELEQVWGNKREVRAGESLEVTALLRSQDGRETLQKATVEIPSNLTPGSLTITVADGTSMDRLEAGRGGKRFLPKKPDQLVRAINRSRRNNRLYVRLARRETGFILQGERFPSPPPSVVRALSADPSLSTNVSRTGLSTVADYAMEPLPSVVTGYKSITVSVKD